MRRNLTRLTVAGSTLALCAAVAVPALAGTQLTGSSPTSSHARTADSAPLTLAQLKAKVDAMIAHQLADLAGDAAKVTASTRLTAAQKTSALARIQFQVDALNALKAQVDAETTTAAIHADLGAAHLAALKARVDNRVADLVADLAARSATVAASTTLSAAQKATRLAKIQARVAALSALQTKVDSETTVAAVLADLKAAKGLLDLEGLRVDARGHHANTHKTAAKIAEHASRAGLRTSGRDGASTRADKHGFERGASAAGGRGHGHR